MASNAEIEYGEMEAKLAAVGIDAFGACIDAGINMSGRYERRCLSFLRDLVASKAPTVTRTWRVGCDHGSADNRGICYVCGAYNVDLDAMA